MKLLIDTNVLLDVFLCREQWEDFEDCLIWRAAKKIKADYIVTRNTADFVRSDIPVLTPAKFFSTIETEQNLVYEEAEF